MSLNDFTSQEIISHLEGLGHVIFNNEYEIFDYYESKYGLPPLYLGQPPATVINNYEARKVDIEIINRNIAEFIESCLKWVIEGKSNDDVYYEYGVNKVCVTKELNYTIVKCNDVEIKFPFFNIEEINLLIYKLLNNIYNG